MEVMRDSCHNDRILNDGTYGPIYYQFIKESSARYETGDFSDGGLYLRRHEAFLQAGFFLSLLSDFKKALFLTVTYCWISPDIRTQGIELLESLALRNSPKVAGSTLESTQRTPKQPC